MRIRTDDEVYRVDAVWLGPPKATFPWRARYVAWLIGIPIFLIVLTVQRWSGVGFGFFSTAWAFVITIFVTRLISAKISHERPLGAVVAMAGRELRSPRENSTATGGAVTANRVRIRTSRPLPKNRRRRQPHQQEYQHYGYGAAAGAQGKPRARRSRSAAKAGR